MFCIEKLKKTDISQCIAIYNQNYPKSPYRSTINQRLQESFTLTFNRSKPTFIVLKMGNTVVAFGGYSHTQFSAGSYEIFLINVKQTFQGKGFGKKLIVEILLDIRNNHHKEGEERYLLLNCNKNLVKFYQQFGFNAVTSRRDGEQYLMVLNTINLTRDITMFINNELRVEGSRELNAERLPPCHPNTVF